MRENVSFNRTAVHNPVKLQWMWMNDKKGWNRKKNRTPSFRLYHAQHNDGRCEAVYGKITAKTVLYRGKNKFLTMESNTGMQGCIWRRGFDRDVFYS